MLKVEYQEKFPKWWKETKYYDLVLSNDLDSLFSCEILREVKGWQIQYFNHNFDSMGISEPSNSEYIGVDLSLTHGKCFDNHVVMLNEHDDYNYKSINFNVADQISRENYFQKYCGSTLLMIWSLYDIPLPESEEGKMILLAIDSTFKGYYSPYANDKNSNKKYLVDVMGLGELYEVLKRHKQQDFIKIMQKYNLNGKIDVKNGYLNTDIDLPGLREVFDLPFLLPRNPFQLLYKFNNTGKGLPKNNYNYFRDDISENMFSVALTRRDFINYSINDHIC